MSKKKLLFVANPKAGRMCFLSGTPVPDFIRRIQQDLTQWDIEVLQTGDTRALQEQLSQQSPDSVHAIFTMGGDGTLNRSLDGLLDFNRKGVPIGILPAGTANDFALSLGMELSVDCIARSLCNAPVQAVDVIRVNGLPLITVGGTGIGSLLLDEVDRARQGRGRLGLGLMHGLLKGEMYSLLAIKSILFGDIDPRSSRSITHRIRATSSMEDGEPVQVSEFTTSLMFVCNQGKLGGNLHVCEHSSTADGVLEVMAHQGTRRMELLNALLDFKRARRPSPALNLRARSLTLEELDGRPITFFGDGEILLRESRLQFSVEQGALSVLRLSPPEPARLPHVIQPALPHGVAAH